MPELIINSKQRPPRNIRKLLTIQTLAGFSQWIDIFLIFSVPAFLWNSSPLEMALIASCFGLPSLFLGPLVGVLLDRMNPWKVALFGAVARTILTILIAFSPELLSFLILVALKGLANILYWPATTILTNHIVDQPQRISYFTNLSALDQCSKIITPLIAGMLILLINSQKIFLASASLTFICSILLYSLNIKKYSTQESHKKTLKGVFTDLIFGFKSIKTLPKHLIASIGLAIGMSLSLAIYDPHLAAFLKFSNFGTSSFSLLLSATGAGAVSGALLVKFFYAKKSPSTLIRLGIAIFAIALIVAALVANLPGAMKNIYIFIILWFFNGLGYEIFLIGSSVNMQNLCPQNLLGRISTSSRSFQLLAVVAGPSIGAWAISSYTRGAPFILAAAIALVLCLASLVFLGNPMRAFAKNS